MKTNLGREHPTRTPQTRDAGSRGRATTRHAALTIALVAAIAPASASGQLSISPTIGLYVPTQDLLAVTSDESFKPEVGLSLGGRLGYRFGPRFGIEVTGNYVPSSLRIDLADPEAPKEDANFFFGGGRVSVGLIPYTSPIWVSVSGGAGMVRRSGAAFAASTDRSDFGGVIGATVGLNLGGLTPYVGAESYFYDTAVFTGDAVGEKVGQRDIHLNFGFGIPLAR